MRRLRIWWQRRRVRKTIIPDLTYPLTNVHVRQQPEQGGPR